MSEDFNWQCPFCGNHSTVTEKRYSTSTHTFDEGNKYGDMMLSSVVIVCSNKECREFSLQCQLHRALWTGHSYKAIGDAIQEWRLIPSASIRIFPDYVPSPILVDYREACQIKELSPKASATLARRCLQGMIRDFWGVSKSRLTDEIDAIKEKLDGTTWKAINAVRSIGNIGAHMEKDINLVIDVDPGEAGLLIGLIETLITEWYIARYEREQRMAKIISTAEGKKPRPAK